MCIRDRCTYVNTNDEFLACEVCTSPRHAQDTENSLSSAVSEPVVDHDLSLALSEAMQSPMQSGTVLPGDFKPPTMCWQSGTEKVNAAVGIQNAAKKLLKENVRMRRIHSNKSASPVQETFESGDHEEIALVEEPPARVSEPGSFESFKSPSTVWKTSITPAAFLAKQKSRERRGSEVCRATMASSDSMLNGDVESLWGAPGRPRVKLVSNSDVLLTWTAPDTDQEVVGYRVVMQEGGSGRFAERLKDRKARTRMETNLLVAELLPGAALKFKISALYKSGEASGLSPSSIPVQLPSVEQQMQLEILGRIQPDTDLGHLVQNCVDGASDLVQESAYSAAAVISHFKDTISTQIAEEDCDTLRALWRTHAEAQGILELDEEEVETRFLNLIVAVLESQVFAALEQTLYEEIRRISVPCDRRVCQALDLVKDTSFEFWAIPLKTSSNMEWDPLIRAVNKLGQSSRRRDMVDTMMVVLQLICEGVGGGEGADAIFPALLYAIAHSQAPSLVGALRFLTRTLPETQQFGQEACYLTTLSAAVQYLHDRDWGTTLPAVHGQVPAKSGRAVDIFHSGG
eukprot:TRINITY_DN13621_c0_g1_i2.p1 TRINITY_DN13621_c0_g1~~TRINITY_DN13621_c0_g1_i2.p1  ORF type:complete len:572 (+),score=110.78 TRINITY_DN13621_c0_g1_i2:101-1816(+)